MNIPKSIKVGGHNIKIVLKDRWADDTSGEWMPDRNEIWINKNLSGSQIWATIIHEVFHVMNSELDHALLESLAQQIFQIVSDNKIIVACVKTKKKKK